MSAEVGVNIKEYIKLAIDTNELALADSHGHTTITPDPEGTLITGDVNVAVTTNTIKGYTLSIYTQDSSKAMSHSNSTVDARINSIDTVSGYDANSGASSLSNNTWGFRRHLAGGYGNWFAVGENESNGTIIDSTDEDDPVYCAESDFSYPLPNANCSSSAYNSYQIGFGAKLTSSLPAGTYTNNVVFSAVAKSEGTKYTMNFNANGGTNTMGPRTVLSGSNIVMPKTGFTKDGYGIKGWAMVNNATTSTTPIFLAGQTVAINDLIAAAQTAGQSPATTNSFTVYAVWDIPYTIAFNKNSNDATGSMPSQTTFQTNSTYTIPSTSFEREGYNFTGWALSASGSVVYSPADTPTVSSLISAAQTAGQSVTPGTAGTITLYAIWEVAGPQPCSSTNPISDANGCILADGNAYIYGNSGNTLGWWSLCDSNDSCDSNTYCPAGYTVPTSSTLDTLISNYSGGGLYTALNLSSNRTFWSSTHTAYYQRNAYSMQVSSSSASSSVNDKNDLLYLLCFKSI